MIATGPMPKGRLGVEKMALKVEELVVFAHFADFEGRFEPKMRRFWARITNAHIVWVVEKEF